MAKKEVSVSRLNKKKPIKKETPTDEPIKKAVEAVHSEKERATTKEPEKIKRTSFDFTMSYYKAARQEAFDNEITMKDYVMGLIMKDLDLPDWRK